MKKFITIFFLSTLCSGIAISHDDETYTLGGEYKIKSINKHFVKISDQETLTFISEDDDILGIFLQDQEDVTNDYQVHVIYILASNSKDKKYDVNEKIEKIVLAGNEIFYKNTKKKFKLDLTKQGKLNFLS